jgi:hypothetical protein
MSTEAFRKTVEEQIQRVFDAQAAVMLSSRRLDAFSGDEDSVDIVAELSTVTHGLGAAKELLGGVADALQCALSEDEKPAGTKELAPGAVEAINRQRSHLFEAMAVVNMTALSYDQSCEGEDTSREYALRLAHKVLDDVAGKLDEIGMYGTDGEKDDHEA